MQRWAHGCGVRGAGASGHGARPPAGRAVFPGTRRPPGRSHSLVPRGQAELLRTAFARRFEPPFRGTGRRSRPLRVSPRPPARGPGPPDRRAPTRSSPFRLFLPLRCFAPLLISPPEQLCLDKKQNPERSRTLNKRTTPPPGLSPDALAAHLGNPAPAPNLLRRDPGDTLTKTGIPRPPRATRTVAMPRFKQVDLVTDRGGGGGEWEAFWSRAPLNRTTQATAPQRVDGAGESSTEAAVSSAHTCFFPESHLVTPTAQSTDRCCGHGSNATL